MKSLLLQPLWQPPPPRVFVGRGVLWGAVDEKAREKFSSLLQLPRSGAGATFPLINISRIFFLVFYREGEQQEAVISFS
jgi:hypothetical protein